MQKELNPDLFGEISTVKSRLVENGSDSAFRTAALSRDVDEKMAGLRQEMKQMFDNMNRFAGQVSEALKNHQECIENLHQQVTRTEQQEQSRNQEVSQKWGQLHQKLGDRAVLDQKMQEMIDRHNSVLKSYELRLSQLQKLIAEREQQIAATRATLTEAKLEIAKLKRL